MSHGITETDNMFTVGQRPWHGLGTHFDSPPTLDVALQTAAPWAVEEAPVFAEVCGSRLKIDSHKAIVRGDTGAVLGIVGAGFCPLQNADAFGWFAPLVDSGLVSLETAGTLHGGSRVWIMARLNAAPLEIVPGDTIDPLVLFCHANDGSLAIRCGDNPVRVVCANTLSAALDCDSGLLTIRHTVGMHSALAQAREIVRQKIEAFTSSEAAFMHLAARACSAAAFDRYVLDLLSIEVQQGEEINTKEPASGPGSRILNALRPLFVGGMGQTLRGVEGTWWAAYNAVTQWLSHHRGRGEGRTGAERRFDNLHFGEGRKIGSRALCHEHPGHFYVTRWHWTADISDAAAWRKTYGVGSEKEHLIRLQTSGDQRHVVPCPCCAEARAAEDEVLAAQARGGVG